jgi:peptide/nickel transport system ATP-binding protein
MRQRVMIAMALALEPRILIMDEPTTALDVVTQREILQELMALRERLGFAVLFITHDLSLLVEVADSIAVMYAGKLVERASARSLFTAPRHPYSLGLLSSFPPLHGPHRDMTGIPGSPPDLRALPGGCVFHPRCGYAMDRCRTDVPPLLSLPGHRQAACWLQDGTVPVPPELARVPARGSTPLSRGQAPGPQGPEPPGGLRPGSSVTGPGPCSLLLLQRGAGPRRGGCAGGRGPAGPGPGGVHGTVRLDDPPAVHHRHRPA